MDPKSYRDRYSPEIRDWFENTLKSPRFVVAPMVDASELPWRMLSRRYKADLCYTPMLHSRIFGEDLKYRNENLFNCVAPEDRPLIVQFCGNDPNVLVEAARIAKPFCDGVDLNLGCPQKIARNGRYGAFLMEEWELISSIVSRVRSEVGVPISCKIRVFPDLQKTIDYAKMLERSGCFMLTVHGRTREQKGMDTGLANWNYIRAVREAVNIPVLANGNIQYLEDVEKCIAETGVEGVMSAEGNLHNPALFNGENPPVWKMGLEYIQLVEKYPCPLSFSRGHIFKLYQHLFALPENCDLRKIVAKAESLDDLRRASLELQHRYEAYVTGDKIWEAPPVQNPDLPNLDLPHYLCQPYVRPPKKNPPDLLTSSPGLFSSSRSNSSQDDDSHEQAEKRRKLTIPDVLQAKLDPEVKYSNNKLKKMCRKPLKNWDAERPLLVSCTTESCTNAQGRKCDSNLCKPCCKNKCFQQELDCPGHKILIKTVRMKARARDAAAAAAISTAEASVT